MNTTNALILFTLLSATHITAYENANIFKEARENNAEAIKQRLNNCENLTEKDVHGNNILHIAAQEGNVEVIQIINEYYDDWYNWFTGCVYGPILPKTEEVNNEGDTPLHTVVHYQYNNKHYATAQYLSIKKPELMHIFNKENRSAAFVAIKKDNPHYIPIFIMNGLNVNKHTMPNGNTILHDSVAQHKKDSIEYCLEKNRSLITEENKDGLIPIYIAIKEENIAILESFRKAGALNIISERGIKPIHYATKQCKYRALEYLLHQVDVDEKDEEGNTSLLYALSAGNEKMVHNLLARGANIQVSNKKGEDAFAAVSRSQNKNLINFMSNQPGIDINTRDNQGQTALMRATINRDYQGMQNLITLGVNIRITDNMGENILHKIARNDDYEAAKIALNQDLLLLNDHNKNGLTPLALVAQYSKNEKLLNYLIAHKADVNAEDNYGLTPLHHAAAQNNLQAMLILQKYGAVFKKCTKNGNTIAHTAAEQGSLQTLKYCIKSYPEFLTIRNKEYHTPLIHAAGYGHVEVVKTLLHEADFINKDIIQAIQLAQRNGHYSTVRFLQEKNTERLNECQELENIYHEIQNLIKENNHTFVMIHQKNHNITYLSVTLNYYSKEQLYNFNHNDRNNIKNMYLEAKNRELNVKNYFLQITHTIRLKEEKQKLEQEKIKLEQIRLEQIKLEQERKKTIEDSIAAQNGTTIREQKAEHERIAANREREMAAQYKADIEAEAKRLAEEKAHQHMNLNENTPTNEQTLCQICCTPGTQTIDIPCINCRGKQTDYTCKECLQEWISRKSICPLCNAATTCYTCAKQKKDLTIIYKNKRTEFICKECLTKNQ